MRTEKPFAIEGIPIGPGWPCYIIAEISANHGQKFEKAKQLVQVAKECGANAVKIQTYTADTLTLNCDNKYFRIRKGLWKGQTLYQLYQKAFTPWEWQPRLKAYADKIGITLFSTPFDRTAVDFLETLRVPAYKIASFELVDIPLLKYVARQGKPIILSTGMSTLEEIAYAVAVLRKAGNPRIVLLKCTSAYPAEPKDMFLGNIPVLAKKFGLPVGLSDHSLAAEVPLAARMLGAVVIEKHLIQSRRDKSSPDADFSLEPQEFKEMVQGVRRMEQAIQRGPLGPSASEKESIVFRKSLFAAQPIKKDERFTETNVRCVRPGHGISSRYFDLVLGKRARKDIVPGTPLQWRLIAQ